LSARAQSASVWTGQAMFIWGGHVDTTPDQASDGALYHPTTRRWQSLPTLTIATYTWSEAFWTGQVVILLTSRTDNNSNTIETHSYDPATNAWTARPTLHAANGHDLGQQSGVLGDNRLFVWLLWSHTTKINATSSSTRSGIDGYTFDLATSQWHANSLRPLTGGIEMPLWTGRDIVLPAAPFWCGFCSQPMSTNRSGTLLDPDTSTPRVIPHGPADDLNPQYIWTGGALLAVNTDVETIGGGKGDKPGEAAVWDPITGDWTRLASASTAVVDPVITWTGASVLIWGGDGSKTVGLQFGP
jgi:hypothetical protein